MSERDEELRYAGHQLTCAAIDFGSRGERYISRTPCNCDKSKPVRDQFDEQTERLLPPIIDLSNGWADGFATYLRVYRPAVAAELRKQGQRIERLEATLEHRPCDAVGHCETCAALED